MISFSVSPPVHAAPASTQQLLDQLLSDSRLVEKLSSLFGTISSSAILGSKLIEVLYCSDDDGSLVSEREGLSAIESYVEAALAPFHELEQAEEELEGIELPEIRCDDSTNCVSIEEILSDEKKAHDKAYIQNERFETSLRYLRELEMFFDTVALRAAEARSSFEALCDAWDRARHSGRGIFGTYRRYTKLEADPLVEKCSSIQFVCEQRLREVQNVLVESMERYEIWRGNMKDLFGIDVTLRP